MPTLSTSWTKLAEKSVSYSPWAGTFSLWAKIVSTDVANNRTKVAYEWYFETTAGYSVMSYDAQDYVTAAGWNSADYRTYSGSGTLRSGEEWITHNADGTKSSSCSGRTRMGGIGVDTGWVSADFDLPRIPRASSPTLSPNPQKWSNTTSNTLTVTTNRKASSFTHSVRCDLWGYKVTNTGVGTSTTFAIPYSTLGSMPDDQLEFTGSVYTQTYSGSTKVGSEVKNTWKIQVDTNLEHPNIGTVTLSEGNTRVSEIITAANTFVQGISILDLTAQLTVSGSYTKLKEAKLSNGSENVSYVLSGTSGSINYWCPGLRTTWLTITAYDERGTTAVSKPSWTLLPYSPVTMTASVGRVSSTGSTATAQVTGTVYAGTYGASTNSLTLTYKWKLHDATTWTDGAHSYVISVSGSGQKSYSHAITFDETFDYQNQYDIEFTIEDLFSTATYNAQVMQGLPILSWDENEVDIFGELHVHDKTNPYIYQDIASGFDAVFETHAQKNLLYLAPTTTTVKGITYTVNSDGSVKVSGTATAYSSYTIGTFKATSGVTYKLSGCPAGGDSRKYSLGVDSTHDYGDGVTFSGSGKMSVYIDVFNAQTVDLTFYPMVRDARIASTKFIKGGQMLTVNRYNSGNITVSANGSASTNIPLNIPTGYKLLAILRTWTNGNIFLSYSNTQSTRDVTSVTIWMRNPTSSALTVYITVEVLCIREDLLM